MSHPVTSLSPPSRLPLATRLIVLLAAFVIVGSLLLLGWLRHQQQAEQERVFTALAGADAEFVRQQNLPRSAKLAADLGQLLGLQIHFMDSQGHLEPAVEAVAAAPLKTLPQAKVRRLADGWEALRLRLDARHDMIFLRRAPEVALSLWHPATRNALLAFWLLSGAVAWIIARQVVHPLVRLTGALPSFFDPAQSTSLETCRADEIGELARALVRAREALEQERQRREQSERLALLGRVATGLAHEIKNPLASIQLHAQLVDASVLDEESAQSLRHVQAEGKVIEGLVNQWLYLARPTPPKMEPLALGHVMAEALATLRAPAAHAGVTLHCTPCTEAWQALVHGDRARLLQVCRNLMLNAIQAMAQGGRLEISLDKQHGQCLLAFRDHGPGFSPSALVHGSQLFFSEKEGGMGVGLNVVQEIVSAHGGKMMLKNHPQGGAWVEVTLPLLP